MLPPTSTSSPASLNTWPVSAVVVDLPLVPVMATMRAPAAVASRAKISVSPITSIPAWWAFSTVQCGSGWVSGTPGLRTSASSVAKSSWCKLLIGSPAALPLSTAGLESSQACTVAPPRCSAAMVAVPDRARPKTATVLPLNVVAGNKDYLSFSVESPISASTMAMIQKRMTMVGSFQPFCSKW